MRTTEKNSETTDIWIRTGRENTTHTELNQAFAASAAAAAAAACVKLEGVKPMVKARTINLSSIPSLNDKSNIKNQNFRILR